MNGRRWFHDSCLSLTAWTVEQHHSAWLPLRGSFCRVVRATGACNSLHWCQPGPGLLPAPLHCAVLARRRVRPEPCTKPWLVPRLLVGAQLLQGRGKHVAGGAQAERVHAAAGLTALHQVQVACGGLAQEVDLPRTSSHFISDDVIAVTGVVPVLCWALDVLRRVGECMPLLDAPRCTPCRVASGGHPRNLVAGAVSWSQPVTHDRHTQACRFALGCVTARTDAEGWPADGVPGAWQACTSPAFLNRLHGCPVSLPRSPA